MEEKTLAQVARETWLAGTDPLFVEWDRIADAVVAAHEARRWKAIESAPRTRQYVLAYAPERKMSFQVCWDHEWGYWQMMGGGKCTMEFTLWSPIPAPPKEASDAE